MCLCFPWHKNINYNYINRNCLENSLFCQVWNYNYIKHSFAKYLRNNSVDHIVEMSRSPKAGHPKAGRSDFRNQRFESDTGKTRKMRKVPLTPEKQGSEEIPKSKSAENAENAENADTKTRKMRKMRMTGFNVTGFR